MNTKLFCTNFFILLSLSGFSQDYFQQKVDYQIKVSLDDEKHFLHASEKIIYTNNSATTLNEIYFHLWPNAYRDNSTAFNRQNKEGNSFDFNFAPFEDRGYIDSLSFTQDGIAIDFEVTEEPDIIRLLLNKPILSSESSTIETPFRVKIPDGRFSRLGHTGQAYYITQWYPKPAVYDTNGWNTMPYFNQGEFYSEYGSFDVEISLPKNYIVGATGDLQEEDERNWLLSLANKNDSLSSLIRSGERKTISFKQDRIHDFAWFADKNFKLLHDSVELPNSKRIVEVWAMYTPSNAENWKNISIEALKDAVYYYSLWNGDYPYRHCTAVDGTISAGGGMEYPNITIIGNSNDEKELERVIVHEVGHNWFYGILGSNERSFPWMDEGINSYYEHRYFDTKYPDENLSFNVGIPIDINDKKLSDIAYFLGQSRNSEQPIQYHSDDYSSLNYGSIVYEKASFALYYLAQYLGEEEFDKCMKNYYEEWKFKHPGPKDLEACFREVTDKEISWFFNEMIHQTSPIDHKLCRVKTKSGTQVKIRNMGKYPTPAVVGLYKADSLIAKKWVGAYEKEKVLIFEESDVDEVRLDPEYQTIQANRKNDLWRKRAIVKKWEPLVPSMTNSLRERRRSKFYLNPVGGNNSNDGYMMGFALHNWEVLPKEYEFMFNPLYGFRSERLNGYGRVNWNIKPDIGPLKFTELFATLSSFSFKNTSTEHFWFERYSAGVEFEFRPKRLKSNNIWKFRYEYIAKTDSYDIDETRVDTLGESFIYSADVDIDKSFHDFVLTFDDNNTLLQNHSMVNVRVAEDHTRLTLTHESRFYYAKKRAIDLRLFAGALTGSSTLGSERLFLSGSNSRLNSDADINDFVDNSFRNGGQDYLYQEVLLSRTGDDGLWSRQLFKGQGGFKLPVQGLSNDWILAMNAAFDIPIPVNIGFFMSLGWVPEIEFNPGQGFSEVVTVYQEYGIKLTVVRDYFSVYFPLIYDINGDGEMDQSEFNFGETISFDLNLTALSPRKLRDLIPY